MRITAWLRSSGWAIIAEGEIAVFCVCASVYGHYPDFGARLLMLVVAEAAMLLAIHFASESAAFATGKARASQRATPNPSLEEKEAE